MKRKAVSKSRPQFTFVLSFAPNNDDCNKHSEDRKVLLNVPLLKQTIVTQTLSVATLKDRTAVIVTKDIPETVDTAQVQCYMHGICQEYCFFRTLTLAKQTFGGRQIRNLVVENHLTLRNSKKHFSNSW